MRALCSLLFLISFGSASSQYLINPNAIYTPTAVVVRFGIVAGITCNDFSIWHTADSTRPFINIYTYPTTCGDPSSETHYSYPHTSPVPDVVNFYKVRIEPYEESPILRVYASSRPQNLLTFFPNPASASGAALNLRFTGVEDNKELIGFLYDRFGTIKRELVVRPVAGRAALELEGFAEGVYVTWLTDGNNVFAGKFIVTH